MRYFPGSDYYFPSWHLYSKCCYLNDKIYTRNLGVQYVFCKNKAQDVLRTMKYNMTSLQPYRLRIWNFSNCSDSDIANTWKYKHHIQIYVGVSLENILEVVDVKPIVNTFFLFGVALLQCTINKTVCDRKSFFIKIWKEVSS